MSDITQLDFDRIKALLPQSDAQAEERYNEYKSHDPFPEIKPSLLNSADFINYIIATGMIFPFHPIRKNIKPASYALSLKGPCIFWDENGVKQSCIINEGDILPLKKNSIVFISLEPKFRIPQYIALWFNLKISLVYKGLLLGTGPLVDPGFEGILSLPLHNLTTSDYNLRGGDVIIYIEFTKLSPHSNWVNNSPGNIVKAGIYVPFDPEKNKRKTLNDYLYLANEGKPIRSSIPEVIKEANKFIDVLRTKNLINILSIIIALLTVIPGVIAIYLQTHSLINDAVSYIRTVEERQISYNRTSSEENKFIEKRIIALEGKIDSLMIKRGRK